MQTTTSRPHASDTDPVIQECLSELGTVEAQIGRGMAERYRQIETARRRALAVADPLGASRAIDEEFALRSLTAELALVLRVHERTMTGLLYEAERLGGPFAATLDALAAGTITPRQLRVILAQAVTLPPPFHADFQVEALDAARSQMPSQFARTAARIRERLHPESLLLRAEHGRAERRLAFEPDADGMAWLHLYLEAEKAIAISERVSRLATAAQNEAAAAGPDGSVPAELTAILGRGTHAQLEADIAAELLLGRPSAPSIRFEPPQVEPSDEDPAGAVPSDIESTLPEHLFPEQDFPELRGDDPAESEHVGPTMPGLAFFRPEVFVAVPRLTIPYATLLGQSEEPGELQGYGPIDAATARRLAAEAPLLFRLLVDPVDNTPLQLDPGSYRPSTALRRWIRLRDQRCRFPGCTRRAEHPGIEIDHTHPREAGGVTAPDNLALLCKKHHRLKHNSRWRVVQLGGGVLRWTSPANRVYDTYPPPPQ